VPWAAEFGTVLTLVPALTLAISVLFVVTSYEVTSSELAVQRLLWPTRIPLAGVSEVWHDPDAMKRSLRLFGNGGLYSITGIYRNATLGRYRAFVTDPKRAVVLRTAGRVIVVSPEYPEAFLGHCRSVLPGVRDRAAAAPRHG
jgi:hypothetical protein